MYAAFVENNSVKFEKFGKNKTKIFILIINFYLLHLEIIYTSKTITFLINKRYCYKSIRSILILLVFFDYIFILCYGVSSRNVKVAM